MRQIALDIGLDHGPSLSNFLAGPNQAALAHLRLWLMPSTNASAVPRSPVPTYLWGPEGSGKTHLLRAAQRALQEQGLAVGWLDAQTAGAPEFSEHWSALLMDDVHLYNASQQQWAFNWFVNAQTHQRAVLAAGRVAPAELLLRDDLRTRLGWGHLFALEVLSEEGRRAVLREAAIARGLVLGEEVMDFMLTRFSRDLGSLMHLLDLLDGYCLQTQRGITIPLIKSMLDNA
jgi:DnaA family protein